MSQLLPLFPLGTVLFPGMILPLRVFEERYRLMVADLLERPEPREFGVIAIRKGREVGADAVPELYDIGCVATVREVTPHPDGRFDLVAVGTRRFRLLRADQTLPYHQGEVEYLPDEDEDVEYLPDEYEGEGPAGPGESLAGEASMPQDATAQAGASTVAAVQTAFRDYVNALADRAGAVIHIADIPDDPVMLSYVIAAAMIIDLPERQRLLAAPDYISRLRAERQLLTRERAMLRVTTSRPAPDLSREPYSPN
ncbi:MAG TPA: LON peptidase substrate-binding domain-containing protein [Trebonia sp.]